MKKAEGEASKAAKAKAPRAKAAAPKKAESPEKAQARKTPVKAAAVKKAPKATPAAAKAAPKKAAPKVVAANTAAPKATSARAAAPKAVTARTTAVKKAAAPKAAAAKPAAKRNAKNVPPADLAQVVAAAALEHKLINPVLVDLTGLSSVADWFFIATAENVRQMGAIADKIIRRAREHGSRPLGREGQLSEKWTLVDLGDVIVHLFSPEARELYDLEGLWADAPRQRLEKK